MPLNANFAAFVQIINNLLSVLKGDISRDKNSCKIQKKAQKAIVYFLKHRSGERTLDPDAMPPYIDKLFAHICEGITFVVIKFNVTFASKQYAVLASYLCPADCQFFRLDLLMSLFPNLASITVERNLLTTQLFDGLEEYLQLQNESRLQNVVFRSPVGGPGQLGSLSFKQVVNKYSERYRLLDWAVRISKKDSNWLVVESAKNKRKHARSSSEHIMIGQSVLAQTEQYLLNTKSLFSD